MDYLQYENTKSKVVVKPGRFKPCYKWITFNTQSQYFHMQTHMRGFKPCYKWITFNTYR